MALIVRSLREDEGELYLGIVNSAIRGLAAKHYPADLIEGWVVPITEDSIRELMQNADHEIRLVVERDGAPAGIGALVVERSELRACYVSPAFARTGCGSALVGEIERMARERGLTRLELSGSLNAEPFYTALGYQVRERSDVVLRNGVRLPAVRMDKDL